MAVASTVCVVVIFVLAALLIKTYSLRKRRKAFNRNSSSLEAADLIQDVELRKSRHFQAKIIQDKLLPGVSGYLGKPIMYEVQEIQDATMNFSQEYRIGGSVYRATINGKILAIKKTKEDVTEELKILQKVNHANLVKLIGMSSDSDGNFFLVYEYAENGPPEKWSYPKSSSSSNSVASLTWGQRLNIAMGCGRWQKLSTASPFSLNHLLRHSKALGLREEDQKNLLKFKTPSLFGDCCSIDPRNSQCNKLHV